MSSVGTLWSVARQPQGKRIRAVAAVGGLVIDFPDNFIFAESNKTPEYLAKFPSGKIPAFEDKDGFTLFETAAIARYVAGLSPNSTLLGSSAKETALVDQWVSFGDSEIWAHSISIYSLLNGALEPYSKQLHDHFADRQIRSFDTLEKHLSSRTFLVTEGITLADISVAAVIQHAFRVAFHASLRAKYPNIIKFYERVTSHPKIKEIFGETEYVDKAPEYTPPAKVTA